MAGSTAELIKEKLDVAEVLKGYITLIPAGRNFKALCPFHKEKSPSFMVSPDRQTWHCFGCSKGGDIFSFVMELENLDFAEALKVLAEKAGIELKKTNPAEYKYHGLLYDLNEQAKEYFQKALQSGSTANGASVAQEYITSRGLLPETVETFELGWASNEPDGLVKFFLTKNIGVEDVVRAGLAFKTERGGVYDRFRGRIMFPIQNHLGKTVGFTGRVLPQFDDGKMGKYVNSPETPIFNKSKILYGLSKAKNAIREEKKAFLVEGQMDMIMSYQAGVQYAVASSGTAFTGEHMLLLSRLTEEILVSFDNDNAGMEAGERVIDLAEGSDFRVRVVRFKDVKDPAEAAQKDPIAFHAAIANAVPAAEFYFEKYLGSERIDMRSGDSLKRVRAVLQKIIQMASPIERSFWMKELAKRTGLDELALQAEANKIAENMKPTSPAQNSGEQQGAVAQTIRPQTRREIIAEKLLSAAHAMQVMDQVAGIREYFPERYTGILDILATGKQKAENEMQDLMIAAIIMRAEPVEPTDFESMKQELRAECIKERRRELTMAIRRAEEDNDELAMQEALKALGELPSL